MDIKKYTSPYEFEGRIPLKQAIPLGLQHVLAMFVGNLTPLLIIIAACGGSELELLRTSILQNAMIIAGIVTLIQLYTIGPIGGKVPIVMGTSSSFIGVFQSIINIMGGGILAYGAIMGASIIGGLLETVLGAFLKPIRHFFPPIVTGTVVLTIGLSLISVGINLFVGGTGSLDFGSLENILVALSVMIVILAFKHYTKGITSTASILIGIIFGYILCFILGFILPTTGVNAAGVEFTKAWALNLGNITTASWFAVPKIMPVMPVFDIRTIIPVSIMFIVSAVDTIGNISACTEGGMGREATATELSGGVMCDGLGSVLASFFGVLPNTAFSQNAGLVSLTKMVNRFALTIGAIFLILCGLIPKLSILISSMPKPVLGGAAVIMFSSIIMSGIQLITKKPLNSRSITIVSIAIGLGYGLGSSTAVLSGLPQYVTLIFGGSGIVPATLVAILLNIILPQED